MCVLFTCSLNITPEDSQAMSKDKLEKLSDCFSCLIPCAEDHYIFSNPLQDKCYIMARSIDILVQLIQCASCMNEKVDELNSVNGIIKEHYDVSGISYHCCIGYNCFVIDAA